MSVPTTTTQISAQTSDSPFVVESLEPSSFHTCDKCGVVALLHVLLNNGHEMRYCWHHGREKGYTPTEYAIQLNEGERSKGSDK
jgi:hypothetical protein